MQPVAEFKNGLQRIVKTRLPFDLVEQGQGVHGMDVCYIARGPRGAVQYRFYVATFLPHVSERLQKSYHPKEIYQGVDVGYHSPKPMFDGQKTIDDDCEMVEGGRCYYDGSGLQADEWTKEIFAVSGQAPEEVLWPKLERLYYETFGGEAEVREAPTHETKGDDEVGFS